MPPAPMVTVSVAPAAEAGIILKARAPPPPPPPPERTVPAAAPLPPPPPPPPPKHSTSNIAMPAGLIQVPEAVKRWKFVTDCCGSLGNR